MTTYSVTAIWVFIGIAAIGTWLLRLSFIALLGRVSAIPALVSRILRLIPAAVLAALVAPALTYSGDSLDLSSGRFVAGVLAALVAWRTKHVLATIGVGMSTLWALQGLGWA